MRFPLLFSLVALHLVSVASAAEPAGMEEPVRRYSADRFTLSRAYEMPWSQPRWERFDKLYRDWQARLPQLDFEALNQQGRVDYVLLRNELTAQLDQQTL